ncbi:hypothetical protein KY092_11335 [Natronomonas gomsonensis]|jgi:hypothetical protein|uniref:hypothetical protein n=1 Tax=Natronomonas gomsonensis TaxID=1046043 RepID=UPI0020CA5DE5|nr:hypothetical protein [Natronomonas gomsonensis]MCY4731147.1 hypothetical protein [Natronomonas gomsonensis]
MTDDKQTTLSEEQPPEPASDETYHAKIVRLCHSEGLPKLALGYSLKVLVEGGIVAGTLAIVFLPGIAAAWYGVEQVTYFRVLIAWGSISATIYAASFCLLENVGEPGEMFPNSGDGD